MVIVCMASQDTRIYIPPFRSRLPDETQIAQRKTGEICLKARREEKRAEKRRALLSFTRTLLHSHASQPLFWTSKRERALQTTSNSLQIEASTRRGSRTTSRVENDVEDEWKNPSPCLFFSCNIAFSTSSHSIRYLWKTSHHQGL